MNLTKKIQEKARNTKIPGIVIENSEEEVLRLALDFINKKVKVRECCEYFSATNTMLYSAFFYVLRNATENETITIKRNEECEECENEGMKGFFEELHPHTL